jgi:hypothetical protein
VRRVAINNVVITNSNRGLAFMVFDGGIVEDVTISDVLIETRRFDWFWWGDGDPIHFNIKRRSEVDGTKRDNEPKAGIIRNVSISNVIAHGTGTSAINGHPDSWLDGIHLENIHLFVSHDSNAPYENTRDALTLRDARNFTMKDVEVRWEKPEAASWRTGMRVENVQNLLMDGVDIAAAPGSHAEVLALKNVDGVTLRNSRAARVHVAGGRTRKIRLVDTESVVEADPDVAKDAVAR